MYNFYTFLLAFPYLLNPYFSANIYLCIHVYIILYVCLLLENCFRLFCTVSEGEWKMKLDCNSSVDEEWIPLPEANFEEAKQVVVFTKAYYTFHRTANSHNLN